MKEEKENNIKESKDKRRLLVISLIFLLFVLGIVIQAADTTPPAAITDLSARQTIIPSSSKITLEWTAPGDDENTGTANSYDIRYSTSSIDDGNWDSATEVTGEPAPSVAGTKESFNVTGLSPNTTYYFAIKTADEVPNESNLSNIVNESTLPAVTAQSGSATDIQTAVDQVAASGGDVFIPEGDFLFNPTEDGAVQIPGGVNLFGAGKDTTIFRNTEPVPYTDWPWGYFFFVDGSQQNGKPVHLSGFTIIGFRELYPDHDSRTRGIHIRQVKDFLVSDVKIKDVGGGGISINGWRSYGDVITRGVITDSDFINTNGSPMGPGAIASGPNVLGYGVSVNGFGRPGDWIDDISQLLGKYDYGKPVVYIEDSYFSRWRHSIASNQVGHYVLRYNTFEFCMGFGDVDAHGAGYGNYGTGTRAIEVYNNTFLTPTPAGSWTMAVAFHRGGGGIYFNNVIETGWGRLVHMTNDGTGWEPREDVEKYFTNDVYIWDNTIASGVAVTSKYDPENLINEGENYFLHAPYTFDYAPYPYPHPLTLYKTLPDLIPPTGSIKINNNACATKSGYVKLNISASDIKSGVSAMRFSNDGVHKTTWVPYSTKLNWNLNNSSFGGNGQQGKKLVYVWFEDGAGNRSRATRDAIIYDTVPPFGSIKINKNALHAYSRYVTLNLVAEDRNPGKRSGVGWMRFSNNGSKWTKWKSYKTSYTWNLTNTGLGGNGKEGTKYVCVQYKDRAGNISAKKSDWIIYNPRKKKPIRVTKFHYDATGNDWRNLNDEYVVLKNNLRGPIGMKGWRIRDAAGNRYIFPKFKLKWGASVTIHTGRGSNRISSSMSHLYMGRRAPIWNNTHDILYLRTSDGKLVLRYSY